MPRAQQSQSLEYRSTDDDTANLVFHRTGQDHSLRGRDVEVCKPTSVHSCMPLAFWAADFAAWSLQLRSLQQMARNSDPRQPRHAWQTSWLPRWLPLINQLCLYLADCSGSYIQALCESVGLLWIRALALDCSNGGSA